MAIDRWIYPRTISVHRPGTATAAGRQGYSGNVRTDESTVATGLPASIQESGTAGATLTALPGDARTATNWRVFIPIEASADPRLIKTRDVVVDDLDRRFLVVAAYWNSLGYNLRAELLEG